MVRQGYFRLLDDTLAQGWRGQDTRLQPKTEQLPAVVVEFVLGAVEPEDGPSWHR